MKAKHSFLLVVVILVGCASIFAATPQFHPTLDIRPTPGPIDIDGHLGDPGWVGATRATGFLESSPGDQVDPDVETVAWVTYDEANLYVAFLAYDDPSQIRVSMQDRDNIFRDDYVGVMFDAFGELSWGYELFVNPIGIQGDLRVLSEGGEDMDFDIVYYSEGIVTDSGYQVEMAIPFASLRFPRRETQEWRINFWRDRQREVRYRYSWATQDRDNPCWMCMWGTMTGISGIRPSTNLDILPSIIPYQYGSRDSIQAPFSNAPFDADISLTARYGLTSDASLEATINPDFSQVESDEARISVNNPFALFYSERRPFFQEGSDLFRSHIDAIYTRSIADPSAAIKLTGRFGKTSVAYILAHDEQSPMVVPLAERSRFHRNGKSLSNVVRGKRTFGDDSYVGVLLTDRRFEGDGSGTVFGSDGRIRLSRNYHVEYQVLASHTQELDDTSISSSSNGILFDRDGRTADFDGERFWGHAVYASLERGGRTWNFDVDYWEYTPTFRADNGFVTRNDLRRVNTWTGLRFRPNSKWVVQWEPQVGIGRIWEFDGDFRDEWIRPALWVELPHQTSVYVQYLNSREQLRDIVVPGISRYELDIDSRFSEVFNIGVYWGEGRTLWRTFSQSEQPRLGYERTFSIWSRIRPTNRLVVLPEFTWDRMTELDDGPELYNGFIARTRINYQFTRRLFLRLVVQYDDFSKNLAFEPLVTYRINPFSLFYVGSTQSYYSDHVWGDDPPTVRESQRYFAKLQYLFRI